MHNNGCLLASACKYIVRIVSTLIIVPIEYELYACKNLESQQLNYLNTPGPRTQILKLTKCTLLVTADLLQVIHNNNYIITILYSTVTCRSYHTYG